jgi:4-hydroxy-tetrahydrodipicolinate synthase
MSTNNSQGTSAFQITEGVWPVMPTPFDENGQVAFEKIPELVDFYLNAGCAGIFAVAGSGEMFQLTPEERLATARATVEAVAGRSQVIAGGNYAPTLEAQIEEVQRMKSTGVDAVVLILSVIPLQSKPWDSAELLAQILKITESVECPLGMYECPSPEHRTLRPSDITRLGMTGRFHFLKETTEVYANVATKVAASVGTPLKVFPACSRVFLEPRIPGVGGFNGIIANVVPEVLVKVDQLGDASQPFCDQIREPLQKLEKGFLNEFYPASAKVLLGMRGLTLSEVARAGKHPILSAEQRDKVVSVFPLIEQLTALMEDLA